jgi:hypothetical protein
LIKNNPANKPHNIINTHEKCLNVNYEPDNGKRDQTVHNITAAEKDEHVTIVGVCNADSRSLSQLVALEVTYKKKEWSFGLPSGREIYMNPQIYLSGGSEKFL